MSFSFKNRRKMILCKDRGEVMVYRSIVKAISLSDCGVRGEAIINITSFSNFDLFSLRANIFSRLSCIHSKGCSTTLYSRPYEQDKILSHTKVAGNHHFCRAAPYSKFMGQATKAPSPAA